MKRGNCYVTCEAIYHLLGGKASGWTPCWLKVPGDTHWFLRHATGVVLDPTKKQFTRAVNYAKGKGSGFLTKRPSARARTLMKDLLWQ